MIETRKCDECGKRINAGYVIEGGMEYFCSDECLHKHYTDEEYLEMYDEGNGDTYWTEWDDEGGTINSDVFNTKEKKMIYLLVMTNFDFGKNRYKIFEDAKKADEEGKKWMEMNPKNWFEIHAFNQEE